MKNKNLIILMILFLGVLTVFAVLMLQAKQKATTTKTPNLITKTNKEKNSNLMGQIFLSLTKSDNTFKGLEIFSYNLKTKKIEKFLDKRSEDSSQALFQDSFF